MFGLVTEEVVFNATFDAIVGMAYKEFAEPGVIPFFDSLMNADILNKNVFAFHMSMNPDAEGSELMLGDWDTSRYEGDLVWHDVKHKLFWSIQLDDILIGDESLGYCGPDTDKTCYITPDSGTSLLTFPNWAISRFINSPHGQTKSCEKGDEYKYPEITFVINGVNYSLPSHHWMMRDVGEYPGSGTCSTSIS